MFKQSVRWGLLVSLSFLASLPLNANLRAPTLSVHGPVSASFTQADAIEIKEETLKFRFYLDRDPFPEESRCSITAHYTLQVAEATDVRLEFLAPTGGELKWRQGNQSGSAELFENVATEPLQEPEALTDEHLDQLPVYSATFSLALEPGEQVIELSYEQPTSYMEVDYGYFRSSKFVHSVDYLIEPIKEWTLAEDFSLKIQVQIENAITGAWARMRNRDDRIWMVDQSRSHLDPTDLQRTRDTLTASWQLDSTNLPDTIRVYTGPASQDGRETFVRQ